ncbi:MAG: tRNA (guanosine(37)-N1)-methyltransferase TrmD [Patescibacteria group bacterium]
MRFTIVTIFPDIFDSYINESLFKRARKDNIIEVNSCDLRKFSADRHRKVDDKAYGGGPGMVIQIEPVYRAVKSVKSKIRKQKLKARTILFSTRGKKLDAKIAKRLSKYDELILICGRYEGVDERVAQYVADEEISIGDYVLCGGELPALVTIEAVSRFVPGFLGKSESLEEIKGSYPVYTRPHEFYPVKNRSGNTKSASPWRVPAVLLSGDHKKIDEWRKTHSSK